MYTSKPNSKKIKELGIEMELEIYSKGYWGDCDSISNYIATIYKTGDVFIPAYTAVDALNWLKENFSEKWEITIAETSWIRIETDTFKGIEVAGIHAIEFNDSWANTLWEAIIFIKTQEEK